MFSTNSSSKKIITKNNNLNHAKNENKTKINQIKQYIHKKIIKKYITPQYYLINIINNIIYNEKTHVVARFKDYLILDDYSEFLKRYYKKCESYVRLPKFYEYYDTYSKIYPNYTSLLEGKFIYKNIQKKQRMIDLQEQMEIKNNKKSNNYLKDNKKEIDVFSTDVIHSILNQSNVENIEEIFDINKDNFEIDEQNFYEKVNEIIDMIEKYENVNKNSQSISLLNIKKNTPNKSSLIKKNIVLKKNFNMPSDLKSNISNNSNSSKNYSNKMKKNIFNYSKKNNLINLINDDIIPKTDRTLIEKLEHNLFKLSKKNIFSHKNSNNKQKEKKKNKKKQEIMHLLKPNNEIILNKSKKIKHIQKIKKPKINLFFFTKSKNMNLKFTDRMKLELDKILYKNENMSDENNNNISKDKNKTNLKSKINQTSNKSNSNKSKSISYRNNSLFIINELKIKYGIKI